MTFQAAAESGTRRSTASALPPVVVFGTGGSGTRAVASFLSACGIHMGERVNGSGDALEFSELLDRHIDAVLRETGGLDYEANDVNPALRSAIVAEYLSAAKLHLRGIDPQTRWGFKNPRHIFTLPLVSLAFPGASFVHVLRDGRDMLLSRNRNQPRKHFEALFGRQFAPTELEIARFWAKTNLEARSYAEQHLKRRHILVRIEDLCGPAQSEVLACLCDILGIDRAKANSAAAQFQPQETFGRGEGLDSLAATDLEVFREALRIFGYA